MNMSALLACVLLMATVAPAQAQSEAHGSSDVYTTPDVSLVWSVLRGGTEADTAVIIRIGTNGKRYSSFAVFGINPFTKAEQPLQQPTMLQDGIDVRIPRARFAELPRTEFRFYAARTEAQAGTPNLIVFYLGVPDTTPEFGDPRKLETYLTERLARARAEKGTR
jgi:hypothetical protein